MTDLTKLTLVECIKHVKEKKCSATELVGAYVKRIDPIAVVRLASTQIRTQAVWVGSTNASCVFCHSLMTSFPMI